jgi:hypothetical protein
MLNCPTGAILLKIYLSRYTNDKNALLIQKKDAVSAALTMKFY